MRVLRSLLIGIAGVALLVGALYLFFGLRFEFDGTGVRPLPKFDRAEARFAEIEKRSQADRAVAPAAEPPQAAAPAPDATGAPSKSVSDPWPGFYGKDRNGRYTQTPILTEWPGGGLKEIWKRPVGGGYASMAVAGGRIYTIEQRRGQETATAYDLKTGRELWATAWNADFRESMGGDGPRATPAWDEGRVYVLGAVGEFRCLDAATGRTIWRKNILQDNGAENIQWGMAASPLIVDDTVVVLPGGRGGKSVVAYDKLTGERKWSSLDDPAAYTAPMLVTLGGKRQLLVVTASRAVGLTPEKGELLWEFPWVTEYDVNSAIPVVVDANHFILSAAYGHGAAMVELLPEGNGLKAREAWTSKAMKNKFNNSVLYRGVVYGLDDGILAAIDASTGERRWKGGRYGFGQLLLAGDHLVVTTEQGDVVLVRATPAAHEEVARFTAIEGKTWNVPAMADGFLLVRNTTEMACYRIAP